MVNICTICNVKIKRRVKVNGKAMLLSSERTTCLACKPYNSSRGRMPNRERRKVVDGIATKHCTKCNTWKADNRDNYYVQGRLICIPCELSTAKGGARKSDFKLQAVQYLGSKCKDCCGVFPICVYAFHHRDPKQKDFIISRAGYKWTKRIRQELDKCDLLCHNCHSIRHAVMARSRRIAL